jgi:crossover junction endodeoxyribonuclease RuvC
LADLSDDISAILSEHDPDLLAVEDLYAHYKHPQTAILMGHARGVILLAAARVNIEIRSYPSTMIKRVLTGNGRASKTQIQRAVQAQLGLERLPEPPDVADAIATALCGALDLARRGIETDRMGLSRQGKSARAEARGSPGASVIIS